MTDAQFDTLADKVDKIHRAVIELNTRFNGGPGEWPQCRFEATARADQEKRLRDLEKAAWKTAGGAGVLSAILALAGQYVIKHL